MKILITGASGQLGSALSSALISRGDHVIGVSRSIPDNADQNIEWVTWQEMEMTMSSVDAVVNLAGAGIMDKRWTSKRKRELRNSRVERTQQVVDAIRRSGHPRTLISASAIGYYGEQDATPINEKMPKGEGFLASLCGQWEEAANIDIRTVIMRFGIVLSAQGGALVKMARPFKFGLGGPVGNGNQGFSWVHINDAVGLMLFAIDNGELAGAVNVTAPNPITNRQLASALGSQFRRPVILPVPPIILRILLGERSLLLTSGQFVHPKIALDAGYSFSFPNIQSALAKLYEK